ncbi:MAG TPA: PRC-barrel domain-containing protein [Chloroflexaceae bacterium]|nr:PRC-barrel domain-containing protein [Chloroflexaceae bacterium]
MLRSGDKIRGLAIGATDGEIGKVDQFLFDDERWGIRYMVVNTAGWLLKELVLLSPRSIAGVDWDGGRVEVSLTRQQVEDAPPISADAPVSRQMESELATYYGYQPYWYGPGLWGGGAYPFGAGLGAGYPAAMMAAAEGERPPAEAEQGDQHLRSTREVQGYAIRALDGEIGEVRDFLMDDETWAIRYLVIDTGGWWSGKQVLIAPLWATAVNWTDRVVELDLTRDQIKSGPAYDPERLNRDEEQRLHEHHRRTGYWENVLF